MKPRDHWSPVRAFSGPSGPASSETIGPPAAGGSGWRLLLTEPPQTQHPPPAHVQKGPSLSRGTPSCVPTSQATAAGSRVLMPRPPGHAPWEWESPVRTGMAHSVWTWRAHARKAPRLDKARSTFFSQRTPGRTPGRPDQAGHQISDPAPTAGIRRPRTPGPPEDTRRPPRLADPASRAARPSSFLTVLVVWATLSPRARSRLSDSADAALSCCEQILRLTLAKRPRSEADTALTPNSGMRPC